jgi:hypothetical protein
MGSIGETYALTTGLKISKPHIYTKFFPVPFEKYIVVQPRAKFPSRCYDYWDDVFTILFEKLKEKDIGIIQVGIEGEQPINHGYNIIGRTKVGHLAHILKNALLFVGPDSLPCHICAHFGIPWVGLYPNMYSWQSKPISDNAKFIAIEPERDGVKPTYAQQEMPKTINSIPPEKIARAIDSLLGLGAEISQDTLFIGDKYHMVVLECIPNQVIAANAFKDVLLNIRYDYVEASDNNKNMMYNQVATRRCLIMTDKELDVDVLQKLKANIDKVVVNVKDASMVNFVKNLQSKGVPVFLISELSAEEIFPLKLAYSEYAPIFKQDIKTKPSGDKISADSAFRTNKFIFSVGQIFPSKYHYIANKPIASFSEQPTQIGEANDSEDFWKEQDFFYIFNR